jgi:hypothetical protein
MVTALLGKWWPGTVALAGEVASFLVSKPSLASRAEASKAGEACTAA